MADLDKWPNYETGDFSYFDQCHIVILNRDMAKKKETIFPLIIKVLIELKMDHKGIGIFLKFVVKIIQLA